MRTILAVSALVLAVSASAHPVLDLTAPKTPDSRLKAPGVFKVGPEKTGKGQANCRSRIVAARAAGLRRVIYASSIHAVSGGPTDVQVKPEDPVNPGDLYGVSKCFGEALARYMAAHLTIIRPNVFHLDGQESMWRDRLIDMGKRDVLLIFDIRRYQDSLLRFAEKAHQRGVRIILFTDQWLSPIARFARHVIAGRTAVPSPWDSSAALFVVTETLIAAVTRQLEVESARRLREMEDLR